MHLSNFSTVLLVGLASASPLVERQAISSSTSAISKPTQLLGTLNASPNPKADPGFVGSLITSDSTVARFKTLNEAVGKGKAALKFDFNPSANLNSGQTVGTGGRVVVANRASFPLVTGLGITGAGLFFAPCGINTPHVHPRGTEFFTVVTNSTFRTGFVLENGFTQEQNTTLTQYQATVFPMGSIQWQQNMECEPAVAIACLSSDDPGTSSIAQNFVANTDPSVVEAVLGYPEQITPDNIGKLKAGIPPSIAFGVQECYKRCGFTY